MVKTPYSLLPSVALLALALLGCSGSQRSDGGNWVAVYDTVGDTLIVRTESGSVWGEAAALVADVTIGTLEGPDEYMLGDVVSLAVDTDGSIYIYDGHAKALRKYAPEGTYLGTFGREGAGPGEYKTPDAGLVVLSDGRVVLRDPGNARFNIYSSTGEFLDSWRAMGSIRSSYPMFRDTADNVYSRVVIQANADVSEWKFGLARYGPDGEPADTLAEIDYDFEPAQVEARGTGERPSYASTPVPFTPQVASSFSPLAYRVAGLPTRYAVDLFMAADRVLRIERGDWRPVPVMPEERAERERRITDAMRQWLDPGWRWNGPAIPHTKPPYDDIFVGQGGRIWVKLCQPAHQREPTAEDEPDADERTWVEPVAFDLFEPDGRYLGMVRAPAGFRMYPQPVARGDTVWAVVRDELEVPHVARLRVEPASRQ